MVALILWWAGIGCEALILLRALVKRRFSFYPTFYFYLAWVMAVSVTRFYVYRADPGLYQSYYWYTQYPTILLGYGVLLEIYRHALQSYAGASRLARTGLISALGFVVLKASLGALAGGFQSLAITAEDLERNLRTVQAVLIFVLVGVLFYYGIPIGRNLKGLVLGYGFFVSASLIDTALTWHLGRSFRAWWGYFYSAAYFFSLIIWCLTLWSYQPSPEPKIQPLIERDYGVLAESTRRLLAAARGYLVRAVRP